MNVETRVLYLKFMSPIAKVVNNYSHKNICECELLQIQFFHGIFHLNFTTCYTFGKKPYITFSVGVRSTHLFNGKSCDDLIDHFDNGCTR